MSNCLADRPEYMTLTIKYSFHPTSRGRASDCKAAKEEAIGLPVVRKLGWDYLGSENTAGEEFAEERSNDVNGPRLVIPSRG